MNHMKPKYIREHQNCTICPKCIYHKNEYDIMHDKSMDPKESSICPKCGKMWRCTINGAMDDMPNALCAQYNYGLRDDSKEKKQEILDKIKDSKDKHSSDKNRMGCPEDWYDVYYCIGNTFQYDDLCNMTCEELVNLVKLATKITEALY